MIEYINNYLFYILNDERKVDIKSEFIEGRGCYGKVRDFNFKNGKIIISVFDYGMYFPREYSKDQLSK